MSSAWLCWGSDLHFSPRCKHGVWGGFMHPYGAAEGWTLLFSLLPPAPTPGLINHPTPPCAGGDSGWADGEVDSSCAGQPIHLWQFLKELLLKPHNYGRFIRWLNKEKGGRALLGSGEGSVGGSPQTSHPRSPHVGIFKIEDSAQVARLWGIRKNRPAMNYDKLSRSIRQYYKKGIIRKPDISQRLVYQFVHPL